MKKLVVMLVAIFIALPLFSQQYRENIEVIRISSQKVVMVNSVYQKIKKTDTTTKAIVKTTITINRKYFLDTLKITTGIKNWQIKKAYNHPGKVMKWTSSVYGPIKSRSGFLGLKKSVFDSIAHQSFIYYPSRKEILYQKIILSQKRTKFNWFLAIAVLIVLITILKGFFFGITGDEKGLIDPILLILSFFAIIIIFFVVYKVFFSFVLIAIILIIIKNRRDHKKKKKENNL